MCSSRGPSRPRDWSGVSYVSYTGRQVLYNYRHTGSPFAAEQFLFNLSYQKQREWGQKGWVWNLRSSFPTNEPFKSLRHLGNVAWPPRLTLPCLLFWVHTLLFLVRLLLTSPFPWQTVSCEGMDHILHPTHPLSLYLLIQVPATPRTLRDMFALWGKHFLLTSIKSGCRILGLDLGLSFVGSLCVGWCTRMTCTLRYHTDWIYCAHFRDAGAAAPCEKWWRWDL